jgi:hypothetical protein
MLLRLNMSNAGAILRAKLAATKDLVSPICDAYEAEGSRRFNQPNQVGGEGEKSCVRGQCLGRSEWAKKAQEFISGKVPGHTLNVTNNYVELSGSPLTGKDFHLPTITNGSGSSQISINTWSQCYWNDFFKEQFENFDAAISFTSAQEIGTKMASRQCTLIKGAGLMDTPFTVDSENDFCAQFNQLTYEWGLAHAPKRTQERFKQYGQKFKMGPTVMAGGGPLWLWGKLKFEAGSDADKTVTVTSSATVTSIDYWKQHFPFPRPSAVPDPGCYHYCKLLSPARVLEWMHVDGLRLKRALEPPSDTTPDLTSLMI